MIFKEKKTPTLLMMPLANGWRAVHKKYKNEYGTVICTEKGDTVEVVTDFGEFSTERAEAVESAAVMFFENNGVKEITVDGEKLTREAWREKEDARLNALHRTREDYKNVLGKPVHCVTDRPLGSAHPHGLRHPDHRCSSPYLRFALRLRWARCGKFMNSRWIPFSAPTCRNICWITARRLLGRQPCRTR